MSRGERRLADETATLAAGAALARALEGQPGPFVVTLRGELGAGKTTLARGLLRALGVEGTIRSPSYTLVEEHVARGWDVLHLDLYRLDSADSLEDLGLRDRHQHGTLMLVEWPERAGRATLPAADLAVQLAIETGAHRLTLEAQGSQGDAVLHAFLAAAPDETSLSP